MTKDKGMIVADYTEITVFTLEEMGDICHLSIDVLHDFIQYDVIHPVQSEPQPRFDLVQLRRAQTALRLQRDLEINLAAAALVLDLLDEIDELRTRMALMEKHHL